ncbi:AdoMet-homocysteine methyltransferase [Vermiconidia calcicola]|uniref:AdoMet-homocysteine methyltransferase n=1 Tax=Vermiconidia calcicola TaxID=1690605 RepID=A0ACC3NYB3_9PEZI|nr:AdoMet-homocysteine methyltransferase [Vermiconidia calcicola]
MLTRGEFDAILADRRNLVIDGALATELEERGYDLNHAMWSAKILKDDPDSIRKVHLDYFLAGADVAITASYQASTQGLHHHYHMREDEAVNLIKKSVKLAQQARDEAYCQGVDPARKLLVAGSVGPYGAYLADGSEYRGDYKRAKEEFQVFHRPRIRALVDAGVDLLAIETIPKMEEVEAVLEMLRDEFPGALFWISCTLRNAHSLSDGTLIKHLLSLVERHADQLVAVGINCIPAGMVLGALQHMRMYTHLPLLCYPNSGEIWDARTKTWSSDRSEGGNLDREVKKWQATGARLIGGCCRTGPTYTKLVAKAIA